MTYLRSIAATVAFAALGACAHAEMTGDEHRAAAVNAEQQAAVERSEYHPEATAVKIVPSIPVEGAIDQTRVYNPTEPHLTEADRQMRIAFDHLKAAERLERYEDAACLGLPRAERVSCPLLAPHVAAVEEGSQGITLHLKAGAPANALSSQLRCHLAFAKANNFVSAPCPLFVKGASISLRDGTKIDILSSDPKVAAQLKREARKMFGESADSVARN